MKTNVSFFLTGFGLFARGFAADAVVVPAPDTDLIDALPVHDDDMAPWRHVSAHVVPDANQDGEDVAVDHVRMQVSHFDEERGPLKFQACDNRPATFIVESVMISPKPARADGNVTVEVTAKLLERIEHGAQMHATFSLSTAVQARRTFDFCNDLEGADCPRGAGPVKLSLTQWLPRKIPVWLKYNVHVNLRDRHGKSLGCTYLVVQPEGPVDGPAVLAADDFPGIQQS